MTEPETLISQDGGLVRMILNRPKVLNALSPSQYGFISAQLASWAADDSVTAIVVEGAGERAFCAGGDIRALYDARLKGDTASGRAMFRDEYRMDRGIHHFAKPYVAILDGIVMGGGAGLSINGRFRVATERTQFAMPETGIGFFPDVGATYFLNRCPGHVGLYLGLTGARLGPADTLWSGLATHFVPTHDLEALRRDLGQAAQADDPMAAVGQCLNAHHRDPGPGPMEGRAGMVDRCFGHSDLNDIISSLRAERGTWSEDTLEALTSRSPTSLAVTFRQLRQGRNLDFDTIIAQEFRLACRFVSGHEVYEGIRAQVVDKDRCPVWNPASLSLLEPILVDAYFMPHPADEPLDLP